MKNARERIQLMIADVEIGCFFYQEELILV